MFKGYRTMIVNVLFMVVPILEMTEMTAIIPKEYLPWYVLGVAIVNMVLRTLTTTPVGQK